MTPSANSIWLAEGGARDKKLDSRIFLALRQILPWRKGFRLPVGQHYRFFLVFRQYHSDGAGLGIPRPTPSRKLGLTGFESARLFCFIWAEFSDRNMIGRL